MIDTQALKQKILDMAIRGQLVPQNPDDEPASILLEKIHAEKQRLIKEGKIKKDKADSVIYKGVDNRHYEKVPEGWEICRLSNILFARTGATFNKGDAISQQAENYIRVLRGGNIEPYKITYRDDDLFISSEKVKDTILLQQYDIITPAVTSLENIGKMACYMQPINDQMTVGGFVYILTPYLCDLAYSKFILYQLTSPIFIKSLQSISKKSGAAFYNINKEKLNNLHFYLPPYAEQARIVEFVDALFEQVELIENNQAKLEKLYDDLKKKTLNLAIRGKLVPQDENDEPASELLKRIRDEKKAQLGKKYVDSYIYKGDDNCYYEHIDGKAINEPIETPFDIPDSWCWARIKIIFNLQAGKFISADKILSNNGGDLYPCYGGNGLRGYVQQYNYDGDYPLIGRQGALCGNINRAIGKFYATEHAVTVTRYCEMNIGLICAFLQTINLNQYSTATAQPGLAVANINNLLFPVPPLSEQKRIVDRINKIFAKL